MTAVSQARELIGRAVVDSDGAKIGKVGQVYVNDQSGEPEWITVATGMFGRNETFIPLHGAGVSKDVVNDAPHVDPDGHTDEDEQRQLYDYYAGHLGPGAQPSQTGAPDADADAGAPAPDVPNVPDASTDAAMTRSEEQLQVDTERVETGRARLRKYVVTEEVTQTVPVPHEEVRLEREPITDADPTSAAEIGENEQVVTLHAEQPVVSKQTVPVERVRLGTEEVAGEQTVTDTVRKEQLDAPDVGNRHDKPEGD